MNRKCFPERNRRSTAAAATPYPAGRRFWIVLLAVLLLAACVPAVDLKALTPLPTVEGAVPLWVATEALDALTTFRYLTDGEVTSDGNVGRYHVEGIYQHEGRAWRARCTVDAAGQEAALEIYSTESRLWWSAPGANDWQAVTRWPAFRQIAEDSGPFAYWPVPVEYQPGVPQPETRQVDGLACRDYLFQPLDTSREATLRLCLTPDTSVPLRMEYTAQEKERRIHVVREFVDLNDATIVVPSPFE
jgi:hypothetical protein